MIDADYSPPLLEPSTSTPHTPELESEKKTDPSAKIDFDKKIVDAREQGRKQLELGLEKVKAKMLQLKEKIKVLPKKIGDVAEAAFAEAFTVPARAENFIDALQQKIKDAEATMKEKVEAAKARFEARRQDLIRRAQEAINSMKERSRGFFGRIKESWFSSSRKREEQDMLEMTEKFLAQAKSNNVEVTEGQLKIIIEGLLKLKESHRRNASQIKSFFEFYFRGARPKVTTA